MAKKMFTYLAIKKLEPAAKRLELPDAGAPCFYVCVEPTGAKGFAMRFRRPDGRNARLVLGSFDPTVRRPHPKPEIGASLTITEARLLAGRIHHERASGADVISERKAMKLKQRLQIAADNDNAFGVLAPRYFEDYARHRTRRWIEAARYFGLAYREGESEPTVNRGGLCDRWADRPVRNIGPADIRVVVDEAIKRSVPGLERRREGPRAEATGRALHARLSAFFRWCVDDMRIETNPCSKLRRPAPSKSRERVMSDAELVAVWKACDGLVPQYGGLVRLLIVSGARLREIGYMRWSELNGDLSLWSLPATRAKNGRDHLVPLPPLARDIINSVPRVSDVFVLSLGGDKALESYARLKRQLDGLARVSEPWTLHDLRRTMASGLQKLGIKLEVTEAVLNHVGGSRSGIVGVYQRYAFDDEKRAALEAWAAHVEALVEGREAAASNVVELAGRRA